MSLLKKIEKLQAEGLPLYEQKPPPTPEEVFEGKAFHDKEDDTVSINKIRHILDWQTDKSVQTFLPPPIIPPAPQRFVSNSFMNSIACIWQWMKREGLPTELPIEVTIEKIDQAITPFVSFTMNYWPLGCDFENDLEEFVEGPIRLNLPYVDGNQDEAWAFQAFLEDGDSVASFLMHEYDEDHNDITPEDCEIVDQHGFVEIVKHYIAFEGEKAWDPDAGFDRYERFYKALETKYPNFDANEFSLISDCPQEIEINDIDDIDLAIDLCKAWDEMTSKIPNWWHLVYRDESKEFEEFVAELCRVWRLK